MARALKGLPLASAYELKLGMAVQTTADFAYPPAEKKGRDTRVSVIAGGLEIGEHHAFAS